MGAIEKGSKCKVIHVGKPGKREKIGTVIGKWFDEQTYQWVYKVQLENGRIIEMNEQDVQED